ncbi:VOC family protein [Limoniibacter endophyticus]|uniref:VOC domain-containing protein n=1 Tax=Limoniibacter endophyticus TaxID=1565040 RepID=A0A8J3DRR8_9HYPH|nr:VOC family protein [Limoniibacter endophyticus]GHC77784.1 hypothetical protein GCM10010136_29240 [Limoniibacter endophyticus]
MKIEFDHVHVFSHSPETLGKWFEDFFDADVQHLENMSEIRVDDLEIFVHQIAGKEPLAIPTCGVNHLGFRVEEIDEVYRRFKSKGAHFHKDITTPRPGLRMFFVLGPDNVVVEILERHDRFLP